MLGRQDVTSCFGFIHPAECLPEKLGGRRLNTLFLTTQGWLGPVQEAGEGHLKTEEHRRPLPERRWWPCLGGLVTEGRSRDTHLCLGGFHQAMGVVLNILPIAGVHPFFTPHAQGS